MDMNGLVWKINIAKYRNTDIFIAILPSPLILNTFNKENIEILYCTGDNLERNKNNK